MGKNPPPKREMKEDAWMDGVIKTPHCDHPVYTIEKNEKRKRDKIGSPHQRRMPTSDFSNEEADPRL